MTDKLSIANETRQFDLKNRDFWSELTDEERKKFSTYVMMRWGASVEGNADFQEWYLRSCNERVNVNFFDLNKHPQLQWLLCTTVSPGMGTHRHYWQGSKKKEGEGNSKVRKFYAELRPELRDDELDLLAQINDLKSTKVYAKQMGMSDADIKKRLG